MTQQIVLNISELTIKGRAGSLILLQTSIVPFLCNNDNITIDELTMTSD